MNISMRARLALLTAFMMPAVSQAAAVEPTEAVLDTTLGEITIRFESARAPITVKNFIDYAKAGHYDATIFHRVIDGFMIQGGGFTADMRQKKTKTPIVNEARGGLSNSRGTVAMARTPDPHSATSQFFINTVNNDFLDAKNAADGWGYTVFARVVKGMDVVDKISMTPTGIKSGMRDVPVKPVTIRSVKLKN